VATNAITTATSATVINDNYQTWGTAATATSAPLVSKRARVICGTGIGTEAAITQNAYNQLTSAGFGTPDGSSMYAVYGIPVRGSSAGGCSLIRLYGTSNWDKCRYLMSWRGNGTSNIDRYDIQQDMWDYLLQTPLTELWAAGSMYEYNGKDRIYLTNGITNRCYYYDLVYNRIMSAGIAPYAQGTSYTGSRIFTMSTTTLWGANLEYLYMLRTGGAEFWRILVYW
jgi:hypothetical protein